MLYLNITGEKDLMFFDPVLSPLTKANRFISFSLKDDIQHWAASLCQWHLSCLAQSVFALAFSMSCLVAHAHF